MMPTIEGLLESAAKTRLTGALIDASEQVRRRMEGR